ncbi:MAG: Smr/MutS family protein [Myxococcota bacterium]
MDEQESAIAVEAAPTKAELDLDWGRIVAAVASRCVGPLGARIRLPLASNEDSARRALSESDEAQRLLEADESLPLGGLRELGPQLQRLGRGGNLEAPELRDMQLGLEAARRCRRFLSSRKSRAPSLWEAVAFDAGLDGLADELGACIDPDGTLADHASPELRRLRGECTALRGRITRRLDEMLVQHEAILQDRFHTLREGRYVLPVRRDAHEKLPGIVHGTSASGATVFVEPRAVVPQCNRLKMAEAELRHEEARILADLSELVRERLPETRAAIDSLDHLDLRQASARLGRDLNGRCLALSPEPDAQLLQARHPGLLLDGVDVVASDLEVHAGEGLIISGPNAGGKTVALKCVGLAALMTRAGLPFPADEGSRCGFFEDVFTDVGDDQSIRNNLSTFSAHITNVAHILKAARRGVLVLLDEVAGGTDPQEGAALACAVVDSLCRRGAAVMCTTHYEALKAMAARDERLTNAAVGFDVDAMMPTFELRMGIPGASSALAVAARFGIPKATLDYAEGVLPEQSRAFDEIVRSLDESRHELARAKRDVEAERAALAGERRRLDGLISAQERRGKKAVDEASERMQRSLREAHTELKKARKAIRAAQDRKALDDARKRLQDAEQALPKAEPMAAPLDAPESVELGQRVFIPSLRGEATIVEGPTRGRVRVAAGPLKLWVKVTELGAAAPRVGAKASAPKAAPEAAAPHRADPRTHDNTLDLRGLRVDDARDLTESFLDRVFGSGGHTAYILHGIGTGALRDAVRRQLADDQRYVRSFRPGAREEGGERLTVVSLR